ncbi:MAG TPA: L-threonate dehydrogenase [Candidatus Binataceae bacterium]|nr:L-threonate dehydrogenase [Candidatus Binataceae bacterium]
MQPAGALSTGLNPHRRRRRLEELAMHDEFPTPVGLIGLGAMGMGVARSLLRAGLPLYGYDVRREAVSKLAEMGGHPAGNVAGVAASCQVVMLLVVNAAQTEDVIFGAHGLAETMPPGSVIVTSATVPPQFAADLGRRIAARGLLNIDAPVSGGVKGAAEGRLSVMASGPARAFEICEPLFKAIAAKLYRLGDQPGPGSTVKMVNQLLAGVHIAAAAEAMALGIKAGADPEVLYEVISNSAGSSWMFQNRVPHILAGDYTPASAVSIFIKDLGIVLDSAHKLSFPLPLTAAAHQIYLSAAASGLASEDDSAVIKTYPGIDLPKKTPVES